MGTTSACNSPLGSHCSNFGWFPRFLLDNNVKTLHYNKQFATVINTTLVTVSQHLN